VKEQREEQKEHAGCENFVWKEDAWGSVMVGGEGTEARGTKELVGMNASADSAKRHYHRQQKHWKGKETSQVATRAASVRKAEQA